jgi:4-amino-4-deoxy-L-arabinose transferase-like glycosyltransferase
MSRTSRLKPNSCRVGGIVCLASTLGLYLLTLAPTVQGFDSAELTVGAFALGFVHAPGYPLYMLLGHAFSKLPFGDVGRQLNVMSALLGSLAVLILFWIMCEDSDDLPFAIPATLLFATTPLFWSQALRAEVYTLHVFLMVGALYLWRKAHQPGRTACYVACFLLLGIGMGNHPTTALLWVAMLICLIWETPRFRWLGILGAATGVAAAGVLYLYFPLRSTGNPAIDYLTPYFHADLSTPTGLWWLFSARMFQHAVYWGDSWVQPVKEIFQFGALLMIGFLGVGGILGMWGWWQLLKREVLWNRLLTIYFISNIVAFAFYHVVDKGVMFIPAYVVWSIWVANGIRALADWLHQQLPNVPQGALSRHASAMLLLVVGLGIAINWQSVSLRDDRRAYDFAAQLLEDVEPSTLVVSGWTTASVLDYLRLVEGRHPDVQSFNVDFYNLGLQERYGSPTSAPAQAEWHTWLEDQLRQRPLCFIEPLPAMPDHYEWTRQGPCWKLLPTPQN